jgi:hypothetical protein
MPRPDHSLPNVLRIRADGTLFCSDGRNLQEYLSAWAKKAGATEDTPLNIMRREDHVRDHEDAYLLRNLGA